jgi:hypothetical protein
MEGRQVAESNRHTAVLERLRVVVTEQASSRRGKQLLEAAIEGDDAAVRAITLAPLCMENPCRPCDSCASPRSRRQVAQLLAGSATTPGADPNALVAAQRGSGQGSAALSLRTTARPLYTRFANIFAVCFLKRPCHRTLGRGG